MMKAYRTNDMTECEFPNVTFRDEKNRSKLINYLDRVGQYQGFDKQMDVMVYVSPDGDFVAFESVKYRIAFINTSHKLHDLIAESYMFSVPISGLRSLIAGQMY